MSLNRTLTSYPILLEAKLKTVWEKYKKIEDPQLMFHQYMVREMFTDPSFGIGDKNQGRGLLIYHGLGSGKTILAVGILLALMDLYEPIIMVKKSLQSNFFKDMDKILKGDPSLSKKARDITKFITSDAWNSGTQVRTKSGTFNGKLLIIDEAHHFFKAIINSTSETANAKVIYDMIMSAYNVKIVFLSATPLDKDPFELVPCINMLTGSETLPVSYEIFRNMYISPEGNLKNKNKLQNRLFGLVSYINHDLPMTPNSKSGKTLDDMGYPDNLGIKYVPVPMTRTQYSRYINVRDEEEGIKTQAAQRQSGKPDRIAAPMTIPHSSIGTYYVKSRQVSIFSLPLEKRDTPTLNLKDDMFGSGSAPKVEKMLKNIKEGNHPVLIYSQFVNAGLDVIIRYLIKDGYEEWTPKMLSGIREPRPRFAIIAGRVKVEDRKMIQDEFNSSGNKFGDIIQILLISETGSEGLDLKNVREVHILEPYWDWARIEQVQGRAIRKASHAALDKADQNVKTYIYISVPPKDSKKEEHYNEKFTIDEKLLRKAKKGHKILGEFLDAIKNVCIECSLLDYPNCKVCVPNNATLFSTEDATADIDTDDPCLPITEKEVKAKTIMYEGTKYFYKKDKVSPYGYSIYSYNDELKGYEELPYGESLFQSILMLIKE